MELVVVVWLAFSAFILGAQSGPSDTAGDGAADPITRSTTPQVNAADLEMPRDVFGPLGPCATGQPAVIYRDLTRPHRPADD
jgi:hypothetical protein